MRSLCLLALLLAACSDDGVATDAADTDVQTTGAPTGGVDDGNLDCATYCQRITANCTGAVAQYATMQLCESTCASFDPGALGDKTGNTLGCRLGQADAAAGDPMARCTPAGPGGNGTCGSNCEGFCGVAVRACPTQWPDVATCESTCAGFDNAEAYDAGDIGGDTLACRLYHLTVATVFADEHCPHTAAVSDTCK